MKTRHELLEGDCLELIPSLPEGVNCIVTDPPYGVDFTSFRATTPEGKKFTRAIENDDNMSSAIGLFLDAMSLLATKAAKDCELYVFTRWDIYPQWLNSIQTPLSCAGFTYKMLLIWDKGIPGMGDLDGNWGCGHEFIMYFKKGRRQMKSRRSSIIHVDKLGSREHIHPTEKPAPLIEELLKASTDRGDLVVDPFAGSGSTVVAAMNIGRSGIGIEVDSDYAAGARKRLQRPTFFT